MFALWTARFTGIFFSSFFFPFVVWSFLDLGTLVQSKVELHYFGLRHVAEQTLNGLAKEDTNCIRYRGF